MNKTPQNAPELILCGGPNGCGKTTFARAYVEETGVPCLGADEIATEFAEDFPGNREFAAGREFVKRVKIQIQSDESFVVESTLSGRSFARTVKLAKKSGYRIKIFFVFVSAPETCIERIQGRVRGGGHFVPDEDVIRRFRRSTTNFWHLYRPLADDWSLMYNEDQEFLRVAIGTPTNIHAIDNVLFAYFRELIDDQ